MLEWEGFYMNTYECLVDEACKDGIDVYESKFNNDRLKALYIDKNIFMNEELTTTEKACYIAEELGHHHTSYGDIIDINDIRNRKQERQARLWGYNKMIGLRGLIRAFEHGCASKHEIAEYLDVTTEFLNDAIATYIEKYGVYTTVDNYIIYFIPYFAIMEKI